MKIRPKNWITTAFLEDVEAQRVVARELDSLNGVLGICPDGSFQDVDLLLVWYIVQRECLNSENG